MSTPAQHFLDHSRQLLIQDYLPKVERCVVLLPAEKLWWRPNGQSNAVGNLLLHLSGNVREWIIHGVGGATSVRRRREEFSAKSGASAAQLMKALRATCKEAATILKRLDAACLADCRVIQGIEVTILGAIYHAVEHFSGHLGQIIYITKLCTGKDLSFWTVGEDGAVARGWTVP